MAAGLTLRSWTCGGVPVRTGRITRGIIARGIAPEDLTLYEMNAAFCGRLRQSFPGVHVVNRPAQQAARDFDGTLAAVVSGLPLLSMPEAVQNEIVSAAFRALRHDGRFIQFTYGPKPPLREDTRHALGLSATAGPLVWNNIPPARVYIYRRSAE